MNDKIKVGITRKTRAAGQKSKFWYLIWYEHDPISGRRKQRTESTGETRERVAKKAAQKKEQELEKRELGYDPDQQRMLRRMAFADVVREFLADVKDRRTTATHADYKRTLDYFVDDCSPSKVASVDKAMIRRFKRSRREDGASKITVDKYLRGLRAFLRWTKENDYVEFIPSMELYNQEGPPPVAVPREDLQRLLAVLNSGKIKTKHCSPEWWALLIRLLHYTGLRRGEMLQMCWSAVDLDNRRMLIRSETSKKNLSSSIVLAPSIVELLQAWRDKHGLANGDLVLPRTVKIRTVCDEWNLVRGAAGLPDLKFKNFRSTCATEMSARYPLSVVQNHLRHSNPSVTAGYYINAEPGLRAAADGYEPL